MAIPKLYTAIEAAEILRVSRHSIYAYIRKGKLKALPHVTKAPVLITEEALCDFLGINKEELNNG